MISYTTIINVSTSSSTQRGRRRSYRSSFNTVNTILLAGIPTRNLSIPPRNSQTNILVNSNYIISSTCQTNISPSIFPHINSTSSITNHDDMSWWLVNIRCAISRKIWTTSRPCRIGGSSSNDVYLYVCRRRVCRIRHNTV